MLGTQAAALFGSGIASFSLVWIIASRSSSASLVGMASAIVILPKIVLNPILGALADRINRRAIMIAADLAIVLCSLSLLLLSGLGAIAPASIIAVLFFRSTADAFHGKAMLSSTSLMVPPDHYARIAGLNQALSGLIMFLTPMLGALVLRIGTLTAILAIDISANLAALTPLLLFPVPQPDSPAAGVRTTSLASLTKDIGEGFAFLRSWPGAVGMLLVSSSMNFLMQPFFSLMPALVKKGLGGDEMELGVIGMCSGFGFLAGGALVGIRKEYRRRMVLSLLGVAGAGAAMIWTAATIGLGLAAIATGFFAAGLMMPICMSPIQSLIQVSVPNDAQGRIFSIIESASNLVAPLGLLLAGQAFDISGPALWYLGSGAAAIAIALAGFMNRNIRELGCSLPPGGRKTEA